MGIISRWLGRSWSGDAAKSSSQTAVADLKFPETTSRDITRRELVRVALGDIRRRHGLPLNWLECELLVMPGRGKESRVLVQVQVLRWDENLMKYSMAIQRQLGAQILLLDPGATRWLQGVVWQLASDVHCPFLEMPDSSLWTPVVDKAPAPVDVLDRRKSRRPGGKGMRKTDMQKTAVKKTSPQDEDFPETRRVSL